MRPVRTRADVRDRRSGFRLAALCAGPFLVVFDSNAITVALPAIGTNLRFAETNLHWVIGALALPFGGMLLAGGRTADRHGRRRTLIAGALLFAAGSIVAALALAPFMLLVARVIQGLAAALAYPAAVSLITTTYADGAPRNRALAVYGVACAAAMVTAAALGGMVVDVLGWRALFAIDTALALASAAAARALLPSDVGRPHGADPNLPVALAACTAAVAVIHAFTTAPASGWSSPHTLLALALAVAAGVTAAALDRRSPEPLFSAQVLRRRPVVTAVAAIAVVVGAGFGAVVALSLYLQQVLGYTPLQTGLLLIPIGVTGALASRLCPAVTRHVPLAFALVLALLLQASGILLLAFIGPTNAFPLVIAGLAVMGLGHAAGNVLAINLGTTTVPPTHHGAAVGLIGSAAQVGAAVGIALLLTVSASRAGTLPHAGSSPTVAAAAGFHLAAGLAAGLSLLAAIAVALLARSTSAPARPPGRP